MVSSYMRENAHFGVLSDFRIFEGVGELQAWVEFVDGGCLSERETRSICGFRTIEWPWIARIIAV